MLNERFEKMLYYHWIRLRYFIIKDDDANSLIKLIGGIRKSQINLEFKDWTGMHLKTIYSQFLQLSKGLYISSFIILIIQSAKKSWKIWCQPISIIMNIPGEKAGS